MLTNILKLILTILIKWSRSKDNFWKENKADSAHQKEKVLVHAVKEVATAELAPRFTIKQVLRVWITLANNDNLMINFIFNNILST
jgi:hypothetical protein